MSHKPHLLAALLLPLTLGTVACGQSAPPATQPTNNPSAASGVDDLLDALDRSGRDLRNLSSVVKLTEIDNDTGDSVVRLGRVAMRRDDAGQVTFLVTFVGVQTNADDPDADEHPQIRPEKIVYLLQGDELTDRNYKTKSEVRRKLPADQAGRDLLKLGEGPFPLPIGQPKEEVRKEFDVRELDPSKPAENELAEPATPGARRLRLTPKATSPLAADFSWIEIDVSLDTGLPAKVITLNKAGSEARVTALRNLKINADLPADALALEEIDKSDWNVRYEDMSRPRQP